jgi:hypothetical protein
MLSCGRKEPPPSHYPFNRSRDIARAAYRKRKWIADLAGDN